MKKITLLSALICIGISGCATTDIASVIDPAFRGHTFESVAIYVVNDDIALRQDLEAAYVNAVMAQSSTPAHRVIDIAPPTRSYNNDEVYRLLVGENLQAVILIAVTDSGVDKKYYTSAVTGELNQSSKLWGNARVSVVDVKSGEVAWTGDLKTIETGYGPADWDDLQKSAAKSTVKELVALGLLSPKVAE